MLFRSEFADRQSILLVNPGLGGRLQITSTMRTAISVYVPGDNEWTDCHRLVSHLDMQRIAVGIGIDRDRADTQSPRGADHPTGNFATIGNEDSCKHAAKVRS